MRSFNYTGRKKISHDNIMLVVYVDSNGVSTFDAEFDLTKYKFPGRSKIIVEAYYQASWMRFSFGSIAEQFIPSVISLSEFEDIDDIKFRLKVTDRDEDRIIGLADRIKPTFNEQGDPKDFEMLPVKSGDLQGAIWKIDYSGERPILVIDKKIGDKNILRTDRDLRALIAPAALREIMLRIFLHEKHLDLDDMDDWRSQWVKFCVGFGVDDPPEEDSEVDEIYLWIDDSVARFSRSAHLLAELLKGREELEA